MNELVKTILSLKKSIINKTVNSRLKEFDSLNKKSAREWFSELCFCLLTANSRAETALSIQNELGVKGFCSSCLNDLSACIKRNKHRFHNNKAKYIIEARKNLDVKQVVKSLGDVGAREWLVKNIKGLGYKEASHFLRNVGYKNYAILDRHILRLLFEHGYISEVPASLNKKEYLRIEKVLAGISSNLGMSLAELDLYMWYLKTGRVLK